MADVTQRFQGLELTGWSILWEVEAMLYDNGTKLHDK
jgi:hypothetical protein